MQFFEEFGLIGVFVSVVAVTFLFYILTILFNKDKKEIKVKKITKTILIFFGVLLAIVFLGFIVGSYFETYNPDLEITENSL